MDRFPINYALVRNPFNWIIILLMVTIGALAADLVMRSAGINPAPAN